jgi:hypothetical protein
VISVKGPKAIPIELLTEEKQTLQRIVRAYTLPYKEILRAKIILRIPARKSIL